VLEITLTVASAFLCFWVAEYIKVSGVLAVVALATWMAGVGKYAISPEVTVRHSSPPTSFCFAKLCQLLLPEGLALLLTRHASSTGVPARKVVGDGPRCFLLQHTDAASQDELSMEAAVPPAILALFI
jgi:hypothetical protein